MLDRLYLSLPKEATMKERFELLEADSFVQGKRTIVRNFLAIAKQLNREVNHMVKFLTKELAAPMNVEEGRLIINSKFFKVQIVQAIQEYAKQYVLCRECGKPDTTITDRQGVKILKCTACGATSAIKKI